MSLNIPYSDLQVENGQLVSTDGISKKNISSLSVGNFSIANGGASWNKLPVVIQSGSETSSVTSNSNAGAVNTINLTTPSAGSFQFTVNNSFCSIESWVFVQIVYYSGTYYTDGNPIVTVVGGNGNFTVYVFNGGANPLNGNINFIYVLV